MRISDCSSDVGSSDLDRSGPALRLPDAVDGSVDQPPLGIVEPVDMARHLAHDRLQHRHAIEKIILVRARQLRVDHAERVEAEARRDGEFDKGAALELGRMLERRSEEHTSELQSLMRISYAVFCLKKKRYRTYLATATRKRRKHTET